MSDGAHDNFLDRKEPPAPLAWMDMGRGAWSAGFYWVEELSHLPRIFVLYVGGTGYGDFGSVDEAKAKAEELYAEWCKKRFRRPTPQKEPTTMDKPKWEQSDNGHYRCVFGKDDGHGHIHPRFAFSYKMELEVDNKTYTEYLVTPEAAMEWCENKYEALAAEKKGKHPFEIAPVPARGKVGELTVMSSHLQHHEHSYRLAVYACEALGLHFSETSPAAVTAAIAALRKPQEPADDKTEAGPLYSYVLKYTEPRPDLAQVSLGVVTFREAVTEAWKIVRDRKCYLVGRAVGKSTDLLQDQLSPGVLIQLRRQDAGEEGRLSVADVARCTRAGLVFVGWEDMPPHAAQEILNDMGRASLSSLPVEYQIGTLTGLLYSLVAMEDETDG